MCEGMPSLREFQLMTAAAATAAADDKAAQLEGAEVLCFGHVEVTILVGSLRRWPRGAAAGDATP